MQIPFGSENFMSGSVPTNVFCGGVHARNDKETKSRSKTRKPDAFRIVTLSKIPS